MLRLVHRDSRFDKQMESLQRAGKKAALAAKEADKIIVRLINGATPDQVGVWTTQRDDRIDHCIKYNLGSGYRLITSRHEDHLFVLYIGTHDECHRWLKNNKGWQADFCKKQGESLPVSHITLEDTEHFETEFEEDEDPPDTVDEKDLRVVFRALCGG